MQKMEEMRNQEKSEGQKVYKRGEKEKDGGEEMED